jgi:cell shape-determining protein MreC
MISHRDRNTKKRKMRTWAISAGVAVIFLSFIFIPALFGSFSKVSLGIARPFWKFGSAVSDSTKNFTSYFRSKKSLEKENNSLKAQIVDKDTALLIENVLVDENAKLKELLGRKENNPFILAAILARPSQTAYDTLILDVGSADGIRVGQKIYAGNTVLLGEIASVDTHTSKAVMYSSPGQHFQGLLKGVDLSLELDGKGGGNFEIKMPRDVDAPPGTELIVPALNAEVVALVRTSISDPRDPFKLVLAQSPINILQIRFVEVRQ